MQTIYTLSKQLITAIGKKNIPDIISNTKGITDVAQSMLKDPKTNKKLFPYLTKINYHSQRLTQYAIGRGLFVGSAPFNFATGLSTAKSIQEWIEEMGKILKIKLK